MKEWKVPEDLRQFFTEDKAFSCSEVVGKREYDPGHKWSKDRKCSKK